MSEPIIPVGNEDERSFLRTEFLERVAHELRGPAGVTFGALDELAEILAHPTLDSIRRTMMLIDIARRGTRKVLRTADRLSRAGRLESPSLVLCRGEVDLRDLVRRATDEAVAIEARSYVMILRDVTPSPCTVDVDADWMTSALTELVGHALRAARRAVCVAVTHVPGHVRVSISDDRAFAPEPVQKRFSRDSPRRDVGLALPMAYDVAHLHGGTIEVEELSVPSDDARSGVVVHLSVPCATH